MCICMCIPYMNIRICIYIYICIYVCVCIITYTYTYEVHYCWRPATPPRRPGSRSPRGGALGKGLLLYVLLFL